VKLTGDPINFTIMCPIENQSGSTTTVTYKTTDVRLTTLSNLKPGEVLNIRWMYQNQTLAFVDGSGNIVQQTMPTWY